MSCSDSIVLSSVLEYVNSSHHNEEHIYKCPFCVTKIGEADSKGKLYVNFVKSKFHCFKCSESGELSKLYALLGLSIDNSPVSVFTQKIDEFFHPVSQHEDIIEYDINLDFEHFVPIDPSEDTLAMRYLRERGISDLDVELYSMYWGKGPYAGRIIIPILEDGEPVYFVARTYTDRTPRYRNPKIPKPFVFNLDAAKNYKHVILTEGVISSIVTGPDAVAILGKEILPEQVDKILACNFEEITVALDPDATKYADKIADLFYNTGKKVSRIIYPDKKRDPAELGREYMRQLINNRLGHKSYEYMAAIISRL